MSDKQMEISTEKLAAMLIESRIIDYLAWHDWEDWDGGSQRSDVFTLGAMINKVIEQRVKSALAEDYETTQLLISEHNKYKSALEYIAGYNSELFGEDTPWDMREHAEKALEGRAE